MRIEFTNLPEQIFNLEAICETKPTPLESDHIPNTNEYHVVFALFDKDKDGKITVGELHSIMLSLGQNIKIAELDEVLKTNNIQECCNFEQFLRIVRTDNQQYLQDTFRVFDKYNSGYIYPKELKAICRCFDLILEDSEIEDMIKDVDIDGDGRISYDEFVSAFDTIEENSANQSDT